MKRAPELVLAKARPYIFLGGTAISLVCLYFAFRKLNFTEFWSEIRSLDPWAVVICFVLVNTHNFLMAARWFALLKPLGELKYADAFWSLRISFFFNSSLPARLGEPFRVFYINRKTQISAARTVGAMAADRALDFGTMCILLYISAVVLGMRGSLPATETIALATFLFCILLIILAALPKTSRFKWLNAILQTKAKIFEGASPMMRFNVLAKTIPISLVGWLIEASLIVAFSYGVGMPISLFKAFMVVAAVTLAISIPSSPGHIGTFELGAITMLSFLGVPPAPAATIAISYHMIQLIPTLIIGAYGYHFHFVHHEHKKSVAKKKAQHLHMIKKEPPIAK